MSTGHSITNVTSERRRPLRKLFSGPFAILMSISTTLLSITLMVTRPDEYVEPQYPPHTETTTPSLVKDSVKTSTKSSDTLLYEQHD